MIAEQPASDSSREVIAADLLALLVCPIDKQPVRLEEEALVCTACHRVYPIEDGIPNMLVEEPA